jgi:hypothetical protein
MDLTHNTKATSTPFGFWVWCQAEPAASGNGGYGAAKACQGAMYFYALDKHVTPVLGTVSEGPNGIYTMTLLQGTLAQLFSGSLNPAYMCTLSNTVPDAQGKISSNVVASCSFTTALGNGTGSATVTNATVEITGPK